MKHFVFMIRLKNYSCHNVFNQTNVNTFCVLRFIRASIDKNKFIQIKKYRGKNIFSQMTIFECLKKWCHN